MKILLLIGGSILYLMNSLWIGFKISGDMHRGGQLVGPLLFPPLLAVFTFLLFITKPKIRIASLIFLVAYIALAAVILY